MKKICVFMVSLAFVFNSCRKEHSVNIPEEDKPQVVVEFDGEDLKATYNAGKANDCTGYEFGGVAGTYYGFTSTFRISEQSSIDITFGTILSKHLTLTEDEFLELIAVGKRNYGSLGAFSSYPQMKPNCSEIAYTDKDGTRWCSTRIKEKYTPSGVDAEVELLQPESEFSVDEQVKVKDGYRLKGHFNCTMYEVNGTAEKKFKGKFVGIVAMNS